MDMFDQIVNYLEKEVNDNIELNNCVKFLRNYKDICAKRYALNKNKFGAYNVKKALYALEILPNLVPGVVQDRKQLNILLDKARRYLARYQKEN